MIDTHVLADACRQHRDGVDETELRLVTRVIEVCCRIVVGPRQRNELENGFRKNGFRSLRTSALFQSIDEKRKFKWAKSSAVKPFGDEVRKVFRGKGHGNVPDDMHLYETAATFDRVVLTCDANLLEGRDRIQRETRVVTMSPDEAFEATVAMDPCAEP